MQVGSEVQKWYVGGSFEGDSHKGMQVGNEVQKWYVGGGFEGDSNKGMHVSAVAKSRTVLSKVIILVLREVATLLGNLHISWVFALGLF